MGWGSGRLKAAEPRPLGFSERLDQPKAPTPAAAAGDSVVTTGRASPCRVNERRSEGEGDSSSPISPRHHMRPPDAIVGRFIVDCFAPLRVDAGGPSEWLFGVEVWGGRCISLVTAWVTAAKPRRLAKQRRRDQRCNIDHLCSNWVKWTCTSGSLIPHDS